MEIKIVQSNQLFFEEVDAVKPIFGAGDYEQRLAFLKERMISEGISHVVVYADREHFANMEYLIGFEPRFEEALLIVSDKGDYTLLLGNECMSYSYISPVKLNRVLYQNFSLQGQPRGSSGKLKEIFSQSGIGRESKVGLVGFKYFEAETIGTDPNHTFDVPAYIVNVLQDEAGKNNVINFTHMMTGMPDGIRMAVRTAKEVAWAEYCACKTTNAVIRMFKGLKSGISELELSRLAEVDFSPMSVFPMINFGSEHIRTGLRSPDNKKLEMGEPCGICYAIRGALTSRVGIAAKDAQTLLSEYQDVIDSFFKPFWQAIAKWYESVHIGAKGKDVYEAVMGIIGSPEFGVTLNPGHYIGGDEWVNSPFYKGSEIKIEHPAHMQCDIIASSNDPVMTAICEDGAVIADAKLRESVAKEFPEVWERITVRQKMMRQVLGINISDDVLPLSNLNGAFFPYMLDTDSIFSVKDK
jgi:hypothetical protein